MLDTLISSKTRLKLLLKFFINPKTRGYLRSLESEFGEGSNAIRLELNKFESAGMLESSSVGNKKFYTANLDHPLFDNLHNLVLKYVGIYDIVERITDRLGPVQQVFLVGDYAKGLDHGIIDLFILADDLDFNYLVQLISKVEEDINRKIRFVHYKSNDELMKQLEQQPSLLLWER